MFRCELDGSWYLGLEGNWSPVLSCVSDMGKILLITLIVDLGNGGWPRPSHDPPRGVVFHSTSLSTHIHTFGPDPSFKK